MLTRDGERVLEVLLIAAGLALTAVFQDELAGDTPVEIYVPRDAGSVLAGRTLDAPRNVDLSEITIPAAAPVGLVEHALAAVAAVLAEHQRPISHC